MSPANYLVKIHLNFERKENQKNPYPYRKTSWLKPMLNR